jgi:hypothetical protein
MIEEEIIPEFEILLNDGWTDLQVRQLKRYWGKIQLTKLAEYFDKTTYKVAKKADELGLVGGKQ